MLPKTLKRPGLPARLFLAFTEALSRLAGDLRRLAKEVTDDEKRRTVTPLIRRRDFDPQQFEAALLMAGRR